MNGKTVAVGSQNLAAIDTGTTLIGAPTAAVNAIWGAVSGAVPLTGNMSGFFAFRTYTFRPPWRRTWRWPALRGEEVLHIRADYDPYHQHVTAN